jgi:hypothetical protein
MILVPISIGELIDKLTILKIKQQKITDVEKLANVNKEYGLLMEILITNGNINENHEFFMELYKLNLEFWEYHDWQRERWSSLEKSENIIDIELYQKNKDEHVLNDKRAEIKKKINKLFKSDIIEEKQFKSYEI